MKIFPTVFFLGLAGFDPTGAFVIITALSLGIKKKEIIKFAITTFIGTILVGLLFSTFLGSGINIISNLLNSIPDVVYMWIELIIGLILIIWSIERLFFKKKTIKKEEKKSSFFERIINKGLFLVGIVFAISALTDPSFLALLTITGHNNNLLLTIIANSIWILISQLPIFILTIGVIFNKHEKIIEYVKSKLNENNLGEKIKKVFSVLLSILILCIGVLTLVDTIYFGINGIWIF